MKRTKLCPPVVQCQTNYNTDKSIQFESGVLHYFSGHKEERAYSGRVLL